MPVSKDAIATAMKYFSTKGLKGRPKVEDHEFMLQVWAEDLTDIDEKVFIAACKSLSGELVFFPAFAEVRQKCLAMQNGTPCSAHEIFLKIKRKMMAVSHPYANREDFENALKSIDGDAAREAARLFDWGAFGQSDESKELFHKSQFEKLYNSVLERKGVESENERLGIAAPGVGGLIGGMVKRIGS